MFFLIRLLADAAIALSALSKMLIKAREYDIHKLNLPFSFSFSSFVKPVLVIHAIKNPFKLKPEKVWTKPIPNEKFGELCIYDTARCSDEVEGLKDRLDSSNLFIAS